MVEDRLQRRLAAILAADVVGYSRLMEMDEEGTLSALKARRKEIVSPLVAQHQGRVFKVTGDGIMVEFASAVNAVQCAIDLQQAMAAAAADQPEDRRIVLRIGINLGDIVVERGDLYGDGVNIAARLESAADPGGIFISGTAFDQVRNKFETAFHHDVAEIDADAQHDAAVLRLPGGGGGHRLLQVDGALHGVHGAAELHHDAVAGHLEHATLMLGHQRRDDLLAPGLERGEGADLVQLHQPAVADDIGGEDGGKAALEAIFDHRQIIGMPTAGVYRDARRLRL